MSPPPPPHPPAPVPFYSCISDVSFHAVTLRFSEPFAVRLATHYFRASLVRYPVSVIWSVMRQMKFNLKLDTKLMALAARVRPHVLTPTDAHNYTRTHARTRTRAHTHTYTHARTTYARKHARTHTRTHAHTHARNTHQNVGSPRKLCPKPSSNHVINL